MKGYMVRFRLLTESDVKSVLTMDDLIETMSSALRRFSTGRVDQPIRTIISVSGNHAFFGAMPAFAREPAALGAKLVTVFGANIDEGLPSHLASIVLLDPETGALLSLMDGRYITEARTAAVSAVSSRHCSRGRRPRRWPSSDQAFRRAATSKRCRACTR